ncbi:MULTISPECIES: SpoIIE family protein phosphatase [unclassified Streptomyces]|uniref:SpoIIE family protein phosphatase n=1 Tax=unclassified Streptomyces TaxID=2593676 RepID=UPI0006FB8E5A|nr:MULTISPECIES: SpoIIE family protein phosphatase [unclassified Streptomyces]KQX51014.1 phosphatase [Streptomyces sp. Root1304]KRA85180.1 phosphatase [Streptomyces sp. Root66D1]
MEGDFVLPGDGPSAAPEVLALAKIVSRLRAEVVDLEKLSSVTAVVERARGVVMAREDVTPDAAHQLLLDRAAERGRTLLEECWITLGRTGARPVTPPSRTVPRTAPAGAREPAPGLGDARRRAATDGARPAEHHALLAALARDLADARTPGEIAQRLRAVLSDAEDIEGVMVYTVATAGSLKLIGHAGIGDAMAEQWNHIPPLSGIAAMEAIATRRAVWLEDLESDATRYLLIGDPPERWPSRAWIPVPGNGAVKAVVGLLRNRPGAFGTGTRALLRRAVRLCGGPLQADRGPRDDEPFPADVAAVQTIFDALSGPAVLLTPLRSRTGEVEDFRIDAAAPQSLDLAGRRGKQLVGRRVLETYPTIAGTALWAGYLDTLTTGEVYEGEPFVHEEVTAGVPQRSVYSVRASGLGGRLVVSWIRHDTTEREARRLDDLQRLGNLGWANWNLMTDTITWSDQVYTIFDRDPAQGPVRLEELPRHLLAEDLPQLGEAVQRLLGGGVAIDQYFRIATRHGVRHLRIVAEAQRDADGTPLEVHGFFQDLTAQRAAELALRESERANLVQRGVLKAERALGARLQDTLLPIPEQSIELAGLRVDVAYVPVDSGLNVGGDWYSAIELPDKSALFVVGDVAGHGLAAVGTMAMLRFTAKGMTVTGSPLPDVLGRLNTLLLHTASGTASSTATVVMARYQPWDHRLTWVRAGHLPPLLIRDGAATFVPQPEGVLLGAAFECTYGQDVIDLLPGDRLLFYTDGLVEEPGEDIEAGLAHLATTAGRLARHDRTGTLAKALADLRPGNRDDICVVEIHVPDAP